MMTNIIQFYTVDSVTGSAKTYSATNYAAVQAPLGLNFVFVMPSLLVIEKTKAELLQRHPEIAHRIKVIVSDEKQGGIKVTARITEFLLSVGAAEGRILFITHEAFLRRPHWHNRQHWHVIADEVLQAVYNEVFNLYENRHLLTERVTLEPLNESYSLLRATDDGEIIDWSRNKYGDQVTEMFADLSGKLKSASSWSVFVLTQQYQAFKDGAVQLEAHGLLSPVIFDGFASVTLMAANLGLSMMYLSFQRMGCEFKPHKAIIAGLRYREHHNSERLRVYYLTDRLWSKTLRDRDGGAMMELYKAEIAAKFGTVPYLWIGNNDVPDSAFSGVRLPNVPHGLNEYQGFNQCAVVSALNTTQGHGKFLLDIAGISDTQRRRAMLSQVAYQALGRGSLRNPDATGDFILIVPDRFTADDILTMYPCASVARLSPYEAAPVHKKRGREKQHIDEKARYKTHNDKRQFLKESAELLANLESHENTISIGSFVSKENAGFLLSYWRSHNSKASLTCNPIDMATDDFMAKMSGLAPTDFRKKADNSLWTPSVFAGRRTKAGVIRVKGVVLDIELTDIPMTEFHHLLPDIEMIIHPSFSHIDTNPRYRVMIPTTGYMTGEQSEIIRRMLMARLEDQGYRQKKDVDMSKPRHGVDTTKLNSAAIFYLPCNGAVLSHHKANRAPIDPATWLETATEAVIDKVIPDDETPEIAAVSPVPSPPIGMPRSVEAVAPAISRIIDYFHRKGLTEKGAGRSMLWSMSKLLLEVGCDRGEIRQILYEQAGYTTSPSERRGEIDQLMIKLQ